MNVTEKHPFDNNGASSGTCRVCDLAMQDHDTVKMSDGAVIALDARPRCETCKWWGEIVKDTEGSCFRNLLHERPRMAVPCSPYNDEIYPNGILHTSPYFGCVLHEAREQK